jgi:hypothetical protein
VFCVIGRRREEKKTYDEIVTNGECRGLVCAEIVEVVCLAGEGRVNMVHDGLCDLWDLCLTLGISKVKLIC